MEFEMSKKASTFVEEIKKNLYSNNHDKRFDEIGIKECNKKLRILNAALKICKNIGVVQHVVSSIGLIKGFRRIYKGMRVFGGEYAPRSTTTVKHRVNWEDITTAFNSRMRTGVVTNLKHKDISTFLDDACVLLKYRLDRMLKNNIAFKINSSFVGDFIIKKDDIEMSEFKYLTTKNSAIYHNDNVLEWFNNNIKKPLLAQLEEFQDKDSGWALRAIINITFNINQYMQLLGSSYIDLPQYIKKKHACINVKNYDDTCFAWAVTSALYPAKHNAERINSYPHYSKVLNLNNIVFPMTIKQIPLFEKQNRVSVNVYSLEKYVNGKNENYKVVSTYLTKNKQHKHINLLLIENHYGDRGEENIDKVNVELRPLIRHHYVWIKDMSRLMSNQLNKRNGKLHICDRCLHYFYSEEKLRKHYEDCEEINECKVKLPSGSEYTTVKFKNHYNSNPAPFVIYADFEAILKPTSTLKKNVYQEHLPSSVGYYVKCSYDDSLSFYKSYRGEHCQEWFSKELMNFAEDVETVFLCPLPMEKLSQCEEMKFLKATKCYICNKLFKTNDNRVRDHCHLTGKYRGPAHEECNLNYQDTHVIPVVFHNLSGYDAYFIIKGIANDFKGRVELLPVSMEKYISFTKHVDENLIKFRFIDSYRFMASGLEQLTSNLEKFPNLKSQFLEVNESKFSLLMRKGVFPYDYIDSWEKYSDTKLPPIENFYNKLNNSNIKNEDYEYALKVWQEFECKNLGEYSDLYLKTDILLLADVFETFRESCMRTYKLDPAHYFTLPGFTWDAMLKHTQIELELLTDIDKIMLIEKGIRGGLSQCSKRYAKANNKYMKYFNPNETSKFLVYTDINNQYGWAMSQYLPYGGFKWLNDKEIENFNVNNITDINSVGYILEVDLEYPHSIHDMHKDLPFCPEHRSPQNSKETKLLATLYDKKRYVIHYRNLKQALANGLKLNKIHRILQFNQSPWLKTYIDLNTQLRMQATTDFEKNLFKLMNNAVFGKTMENIRKRSIVKLISKWEGRYGIESMISKPNFKSSLIINENLAIIEMNKTEIYFNKPIYVGMCILDVSKLKIYDFHYNYMQSRFRDNCSVLYTDTDSLIYEIEHPDIYEIIRADSHDYFDTSDYPKNNIYSIPCVNKKVLGMMKDENNGRIMTEFIGLRSKMYAIKVDDEVMCKKIKGIKKNIVKNIITFEDYVECLDKFNEKVLDQNLIRSEKHQLFSVTETKVALSPYDDKRYLIKHSYNTLPWGHYAILQ